MGFKSATKTNVNKDKYEINNLIFSSRIEYNSIASIDRNLKFLYSPAPYSGPPARAKRAWDRALYSWNMVNLFSLGCHVTDRAYVRVYRLYG